MHELTLDQQTHPGKGAQARFDALVGIDDAKQRLLEFLALTLQPSILTDWTQRHHPEGLALAERIARPRRVALLQGDVGCGKTELASTIGTPLAKRIERRVSTFVPPGDLRGNGMVGEIGKRVTAAFVTARQLLPKNAVGLLLLDEADDIATSRSQLQAHHEDRAGLNALLKQIDGLEEAGAPLAVILITNRAGVLDPALRRRVGLELRFDRPNTDARRAHLGALLQGVSMTQAQLDQLVERTDDFTHSDLVHRVAEAALRRAIREDVALSVESVAAVVEQTSPSPAFGEDTP